MPLLFAMTVVLICYYIFKYFTDNSKRYAAIGLALTFFMLSSSFAFPVRADRGGFVSAGTQAEDEKQAAELTGQDAVRESGAVLAREKHTESRMVILEDEDVLDDEEIPEGCDNEEIYGQKAGDQYTLEDILEENAQYRTEKRRMPAVGEQPEAAFTKEDWRLVLINKQHPIPEDYTFGLVTIKGSMQCDERILEDLLSMLQGAREDKINLVIRSPYRDMSRQEYLFNRKIKVYMGKGMSYMEAYKTASTTVTVPGASEHQIGLAIDITSDNYVSLDEGFGETEAGQWLAEHSCEYGFILRYPQGKEYITSIDYEPWHFRYVGKEAATIITENGITLEEFVENYL